MVVYHEVKLCGKQRCQWELWVEASKVFPRAPSVPYPRCRKSVSLPSISAAFLVLFTSTNHSGVCLQSLRKLPGLQELMVLFQLRSFFSCSLRLPPLPCFPSCLSPNIRDHITGYLSSVLGLLPSLSSGCGSLVLPLGPYLIWASWGRKKPWQVCIITFQSTSGKGETEAGDSEEKARSWAAEKTKTGGRKETATRRGKAVSICLLPCLDCSLCTCRSPYLGLLSCWVHTCSKNSCWLALAPHRQYLFS